MKQGNNSINAIKYNHSIETKNNSYMVARISANFLKTFGVRSCSKPSITSGVILFRLTPYVDVNYKIHANLETFNDEIGMRSDLYNASISSMLKRGDIVKKADGYYVTEKTHVIIKEGTDVLFAPNLKILSDYELLSTFKQKTVHFLYYLIGNTVSPNAKYTRTYQVCSLYDNKFKKENVGFNLFKSLKELLNGSFSLASKGLIEAKFKNKVNGNEFILTKDLLDTVHEEDAMKSILKFFGYSFNESKLIRNNDIQNFTVTLKVLVDSEEIYPNTANFMEFKNELAVYGLAAEHVFSVEDNFSYEDNEINLFINVKNQLIQGIGRVLGTEIYRDALRYFLSEKHGHLYAYHLAGTGKAVNIFKKYYLMPYLQQILFNTIERIKLEGEFALSQPTITIANYNTAITHEQLNELIYWIAKGDLSPLVKTRKKLAEQNKVVKKTLYKHFPNLRKLDDNYQEKINNYYKKYVIQSNIQMDLTSFEKELIKVADVLDQQATKSFDKLLDKFIKTSSNYMDTELLQEEVKNYQHKIGTMKKKFIQQQIEYAINGQSTQFHRYAPTILNDVIKELMEEIPGDNLLDVGEVQINLLIQKAKVLFDTKLQALIGSPSSHSKVEFYDWLSIRE